MKNYKVALWRAYLVTIRAENEEQARLFSEFYIGNCSDLSTERDRQKKIFLIEEIKMTGNEAFEVIEEFEQPELNN